MHGGDLPLTVYLAIGLVVVTPTVHDGLERVARVYDVFHRPDATRLTVREEFEHRSVTLMNSRRRIEDPFDDVLPDRVHTREARGLPVTSSGRYAAVPSQSGILGEQRKPLVPLLSV